MSHRGRENADDVLAMAIASGRTLTEASSMAGVSRRTAQRRLSDAGFNRCVAEMRRELVQRALGRLSDGMAEAADVLRALLKSESEGIRLSASRGLLEIGGKLVDPDAQKPPSGVTVTVGVQVRESEVTKRARAILARARELDTPAKQRETIEGTARQLPALPEPASPPAEPVPAEPLPEPVPARASVQCPGCRAHVIIDPVLPAQRRCPACSTWLANGANGACHD